MQVLLSEKLKGWLNDLGVCGMEVIILEMNRLARQIKENRLKLDMRKKS